MKWLLIAGCIFFAGCGTFLIWCCCVVAKRADERIEAMRRNHHN